MHKPIPINVASVEAQMATVEEARAMTRLGTTTLYALMKNNTLRSTKIGARRLIHVDSIRALLGTQVAA